MDYSANVAPPNRTVVPSRSGYRANVHTNRSQHAEVEMFGIYEISKLLNSPLNLEAILGSVANLLSSFLLMRSSTILILSEQNEPEFVAAAGWAGEVEDGHDGPHHRIPPAVVDTLIATKTPVVVQNISTDPLFRDVVKAMTKSHGERVAFIGVPIKSDDRVIGTLSIDRYWDGKTVYPFDRDLRFLKMVANLIGQTVRLHWILSKDRKRLLDERRDLEKALNQELSSRSQRTPKGVKGIVGNSNALRKILKTIEIVAKSNSTVLLRGESGTGKELFARAVHEQSTRKGKAFIKLNCAALPESVLESELFGHEKGAFTGAVSRRDGRFTMADGGTLLLDEIGEISASFQAKLLRVLQEGEFERVGGTKTQKVDVRLVCATNKNLEEAVAKGEFRADLYYRINVVPILLPPLRSRKGDISLLAQTFLDRFNSENGRELDFSTEALRLLEKCYFPGNVRELENCVRRTATLADEKVICREDFACSDGSCLSALLWSGRSDQQQGEKVETTAPVVAQEFPITTNAPAPATSPLDAKTPSACEHSGDGSCPALGSHLSEKDRLVEAMERSGWVQAKAARLLGLTPRQIGYALRKHDIDVKKF